jgi:hypothetical protein
VPQPVFAGMALGLARHVFAFVPLELHAFMDVFVVFAVSHVLSSTYLLLQHDGYAQSLQ